MARCDRSQWKLTRELRHPSTLTILTKEQEAGRLRIAPALFKTSGETFTEIGRFGFGVHAMANRAHTA